MRNQVRDKVKTDDIYTQRSETIEAMPTVNSLGQSQMSERDKTILRLHENGESPHSIVGNTMYRLDALLGGDKPPSEYETDSKYIRSLAYVTHLIDDYKNNQPPFTTTYHSTGAMSSHPSFLLILKDLNWHANKIVLIQITLLKYRLL